MITHRELKTRVWSWSAGAAAALTLLGATQGYASRLIEGQQADFRVLLLREAVNWFSWAVLAPLVYLVVERVPLRRAALTRATSAWVPAALAVLFLHALLEVAGARALGIVPAPMSFGTNLFGRFSATLPANLVVLALVAAAFSALRYSRELSAREVHEAELRAELAQSQLTVLRMQLQPHFLFNTLHAASAMMTDDVDGARRVLAELGDFLRAGLTHAGVQIVRLEEELSLLDRYLAIQRVRFADRLVVERRAAPGTLRARIPSLLLQPIVENALRYAIEPRATPGLLRISALRRGDLLHLDIEDDGPGVSPSRNGAPGLGLGLANTRARLERLYGNSHRFSLDRSDIGGLAVRITIPFDDSPDVSEPVPLP